MNYNTRKTNKIKGKFGIIYLKWKKIAVNIILENYQKCPPKKLKWNYNESEIKIFSDKKIRYFIMSKLDKENCLGRFLGNGTGWSQK